MLVESGGRQNLQIGWANLPDCGLTVIAREGDRGEAAVRAQSQFVPATLPEAQISAQSAEVGENEKECRSPVTGMVIKVNVERGQSVEVNEVVIVLESMKMEMQVTAPCGGVVKDVLVSPGTAVKANQLMVEFE